MKYLSILLSLSLLQPVFSLGQKRVISFTKSSISFPLVTSSPCSATSLLVSSDDYPGIRIASKTFASDVQKVSGQLPDVIVVDDQAVNSTASMAVIIGSLEKSSLVKKLVGEEKVNVSDIEGAWESCKIVVVDNPVHGLEKALVVVGSE